MDAKEVSDSQSPLSIPVIDISGIESPSKRSKIIDQVTHAAKTIGFFQVINHGIPLPVKNAALSAIEAFHELPEEAKSKYVNPNGVMYASNTHQFSPTSANAAASGCRRDTVWIMALPEFPPEEEVPKVLRQEVGEWVPYAAGVAEALTELLAEGLGLERGRLRELSPLGDKSIMGHRYPYCSDPDRTVGLGSHTDAGFLTVVIQNQLSGLQVLHAGSWLDVKPEPGALIINIGDLLQILSNAEYKSVQHRVLANGCKEPRISIVMIFNPSKWNYGGCFGPLAELVSPEKPAIYRHFTKKEYMDTFREKAVGGMPLLERVKI